METITSLIQTYTANEMKIEKKKASIKRLQNQVEKMESKNSWIDVILKPMAKELSAIIQYPHWNILGPFGLDCETSIHFAKKPEDLDNCKNIKSITLVPFFNDHNHDYILKVKNYLVDTKKYSKGTLGEINNMNYPLVDITKTSLVEIAKTWVF